MKIKLTAYNGTVIPVKGKCILYIRHLNSNTTPILFIVAAIKSTPILGHQSSSRLNLIRRIYEVDESKDVPEYVNKYSESFGVIGCLPPVHHIGIDENIKPVIHPPRKVPYAILDRLREELDRMVKLGVIKPFRINQVGKLNGNSRETWREVENMSRSKRT